MVVVVVGVVEVCAISPKTVTSFNQTSHSMVGGAMNDSLFFHYLKFSL
jgi:hypothetical protein